MGITAKAKSRSPATEAWRLFQEFIFTIQRPRWMAANAEFDLTPPQVMTLNHLDTDEPVPMSEIAKWLSCDASNVTGIIDRLEARGLVERRSAPNDRRVTMLALTEEGAALRDEIRERMAVPPPEIAALPASDQRALRDVLRRALDAH